MGLFSRKSKITLAPVCMLPIVGMDYYTADIEAIGTPLKGYYLSQGKMQSFKDYFKLYFKCSKVQLVPDPTNAFDRNAIMVVVDGRRIGYVPKDSTAAVRQYMALPCSISVTINGGHFRTFVPNEIVDGFKPYTGELVIKLLPNVN